MAVVIFFAQALKSFQARPSAPAYTAPRKTMCSAPAVLLAVDSTGGHSGTVSNGEHALHHPRVTLTEAQLCAGNTRGPSVFALCTAALLSPHLCDSQRTSESSQTEASPTSLPHWGLRLAFL